jgi:type II secretory pathway pseudopilin PulG
MLRFGMKREKGDTIIEVLFAITVFSFVAIASLSIMNQGSATAERALEITLVRSEITSQAQTLRFLNTSFINAYQEGEPLASYSTSTPAGQWAQLIPFLNKRLFILEGSSSCICFEFHNRSFF